MNKEKKEKLKKYMLSQKVFSFEDMYSVLNK